MRAVLSTNGTLITPEMAERINEAGFSYVGVSLDGVGEVHDKFRGKKGRLRGGLAGIRNCRDAGVRVGLRFTVHARTSTSCPPSSTWLRREDIPRLCVYHLAYAGRGDKMRRYDLEPRRDAGGGGLHLRQRSQDLHRAGHREGRPHRGQPRR